MINQVPQTIAAVIAGPTASGKSQLAVELATQTQGVVINADSLQLYDALPILTARPTPEQLAQVPHRLYGVLTPTERSTAALWAAQARTEIATAFAEGRLPILVGGSGLYLEALMSGLAEMPEVPADARLHAGDDLEKMGRDAFYDRLVAADPESATLKRGDTQRILRAWEILAATGKPQSEWQRAQAATLPIIRFASLVIDPPRETLREACDRRFLSMIEAGALQEVEAFLERFDKTLPVAKALGFTSLNAHLRGELGLPVAIEQAQAQTRQYAKRQSTWFRNRFLRRNPDAVVSHHAGINSLDLLQEHLPVFNHESGMR